MQAIAQIFDLAGKVAVVGRKLDACNEACKEITGRGHKAKAVQCDVRLPDQIRKAVDSTVELFGDIHILVNNAGVFPGKVFLELTEDIWDNTIDTNLKSTAFFSQAAAQAMIKAGHGGKIINIGSGSSFRPAGKGLAHYCAAKGGVVSLTRAMAKELTPYGILCTTVVVSTVRSFDVSGSPEFAKSLAENAKKNLPLGRMGEIDDIAKVVLFLASSASDYVNATEVMADGGNVWLGKGSD